MHRCLEAKNCRKGEKKGPYILVLICVPVVGDEKLKLWEKYSVPHWEVQTAANLHAELSSITRQPQQVTLLFTQTIKLQFTGLVYLKKNVLSCYIAPFYPAQWLHCYR